MVFTAFCLVSLRAFQQQNVQHRFFYWAAATSYGLAFADIAIVLFAVQHGWAAAMYIGTGGALGVTFAMYFHRKYICKNKN